MKAYLTTLLILLLNGNFFKGSAGLVHNIIALAGQSKHRRKAQQGTPYVLESGVVSHT